MRRLPIPALKNIGVPPTEPNALTGELTPPGINTSDCSNNSLFLFILNF